MPSEHDATISKSNSNLTRRQRDLADEIVYGDAATVEEAARAAGYVGDPARAMRGDRALEAEISSGLEIRSLVERAAALKRLVAVRDDPATPIETVIEVCRAIFDLCPDTTPPLADYARKISGVLDPNNRRHYEAPPVPPEGALGDVPAIFCGLPPKGEWNSAPIDVGRRRAERERRGLNDAFQLRIMVEEELYGIDHLRVDLMVTPGGSGELGRWIPFRTAEFGGAKLGHRRELWFETKAPRDGDNFARIRILTTGSPTKGIIKISV